MRISELAVIGLAAIALAITPALAASTKVQKSDAETEQTTSPCSSYQLGADGNWVPHPCEELGVHPSSPPRAPAAKHEHETR
jgi:hypothetical protein